MVKIQVLLLYYLYTFKEFLFQDFALVHYAGDVVYNVNGFLDKNNDPLFRDLREVMSRTCNSITKVV